MREVNDAGLYRPIRIYDRYPPIMFDAIEAELTHALNEVVRTSFLQVGGS